MMEYIRKLLVHHLMNVVFTDEYPKQKHWLIKLYRIYAKYKHIGWY